MNVYFRIYSSHVHIYLFFLELQSLGMVGMGLPANSCMHNSFGKKSWPKEVLG